MIYFIHHLQFLMVYDHPVNDDPVLQFLMGYAQITHESPELQCLMVYDHPVNDDPVLQCLMGYAQFSFRDKHFYTFVWGLLPTAS